MVKDARDPTADDTDVLTQRMQKMIKFREKMLTDASVNIKNAQNRYKIDYDKKRSLTILVVNSYNWLHCLNKKMNHLYIM